MNGLQKGAKGWGQEGWPKGGEERGWGKGGGKGVESIFK